jgi:hypothetical protein
VVVKVKEMVDDPSGEFKAAAAFKLSVARITADTMHMTTRERTRK